MQKKKKRKKSLKELTAENRLVGWGRSGGGYDAVDWAFINGVGAWTFVPCCLFRS